MKILTSVLLMLASCYMNRPNSASQPSSQEGDIRVQTCSRGCYQFILQPTTDTSQQFYVANFPDSLTRFALDAQNNQHKLHVLFLGKLLRDKRMVISAGPDDRPVPLYELPSFQLDHIRRSPAKPAR